jgi:hypothetical protein
MLVKAKNVAYWHGCIVADAGYGLSAPFRQGLTARKLVWAVGIPRHLKVYPLGVQMIWPVAKRGRRSTRELLDLIDWIGKAGASFRSLGDPLWDTSSAQGRLLSTLLASHR